MGGAVSSGESNDELVDNLLDADYIKTQKVERVFRAVDRALYYTDPFKGNAYKDLAWKDGNLHLSAPCIYSEVMENLDLREGMSFLNLGSGTGYLSTMCGLVVGKSGVNHGVELHPEVAEYARERLEEFLSVSPSLDTFDFCIPNFVVGNCLDPISSVCRYDRIYCGAACPEEYIRNVTDLLKIGGVCIMPVNDSLVQITRVSEDGDDRKSLLPVSFASLIEPRTGAEKKPVVLPEWSPLSLKELCRFEIRDLVRKGFLTPEAQAACGDEGRKKVRKRRQERRRASRLLVVQRRRSAGEGETGFVAVAYSLGNHSSDEDRRDNRDNHEVEMRASSSSSGASDSDDMPDLVEPSSNGQPINQMDTGVTGARDPPQNPGSGSRPPLRGSQVRRILNRGRNNRQNGVGIPQQAAQNEDRSSSVPGNGTANDTFLRKIRDLYRRREHRTGFRQLINAVSSATAQVLVRASGSGSSQEQSNNANPTGQSSNGVAARQSGTPPLNGGRRRFTRDSYEDSCMWSTDSSLDSSSPPSEGSEEEGQGGKIGKSKGGNRATTSADSGVTESPEGNSNKDAKDDDADDMEVEDNSVLAKLKRNTVSVEMFKRVNQLPLPPSLKMYLNYYRQIEIEMDG